MTRYGAPAAGSSPMSSSGMEGARRRIVWKVGTSASNSDPKVGSNDA